jgi:lipoprotein-releasing system ATP-binding protein
VHVEFLRLIKEEGLGALIATHNIALAKRMSRIVSLQSGILVDGLA